MFDIIHTTMAHTLFSEVPQNFFSPLTSKNREHYSSLLLRYYRLFETYSNGVERELVVSSFEEYLSDESGLAERIITDLDEEEELAEPSVRSLASLFLRKLIAYGWMSEEILADYTQMINITIWSRPFYQAIVEVVKGMQVEYESHIIGIYSSLCSQAAGEQGHHTVLNAWDHTRKLIDSLKTLSQNMKIHIERMFSENAEVKELLHIHYDLYMQEIVDKAYTRLKTSENLSKYRPQIIRAANAFLADQPWLERSSSRLAIIKNVDKKAAMKLLLSMLHEIRDELRSLDPILEEIDDKNRQYSRISTEKIKAKIYADSSIQGKIQNIIQSIGSDSKLTWTVAPRIVNSSSLTAKSLYTPRFAKKDDIDLAAVVPPEFDLEQMELEMRMKIQNQLSPKKIALFLDERCAKDGSGTPAVEMIESMEDFIRIIYAAAYAEGRESRFPYRISWGKKIVSHQGRYSFREHTFTYAGDMHERT